MTILIGIFLAALSAAIWTFRTFYMPPEAPIEPDEPEPQPEPVPAPVAPSVAPQTLLWDTPQQAYRSTRMICDEMGLTYAQKNIVCACIYQESQFNNEAVGRNRDSQGNILSTDWGIVQVNDTKGWHIGPGLRFKSIQEVLDNPEKAVRWMVSVMKGTGRLQLWASYTSGAYMKWLVDNSPMWKLKTV